MNIEAPLDIIKSKDRNCSPSQHVVAAYSGPIPSAAELKKYNEIHPDFADRIIKMTEKEVEHRHILTENNAKEDKVLQKRGQIFSASIAISGMVIAAIVGIFGSSAVWIHYCWMCSWVSIINQSYRSIYQ
ncbi:MAG TPA: DUF2335 domain-containing protein [Gammaproteobacteria bacterium]|nr:DUF2335 domain-containing protein [Gammaproteobacteria bacterium]